jgi:hypothetical protein
MAYPPIYSSLQQDNLLCNHKPEEDKLLEDIFDDIFNEADALNSVDAGSTRTLSNLVRQLRNLDAEVAKIEENLKGLRQERQKLTLELIPGLMDEMGVERLDVDGVSVFRKLIVSASIPEKNKAEAFGVATGKQSGRHHQERRGAVLWQRRGQCGQGSCGHVGRAWVRTQCKDARPLVNAQGVCKGTCREWTAY